MPYSDVGFLTPFAQNTTVEVGALYVICLPPGAKVLKSFIQSYSKGDALRSSSNPSGPGPGVSVPGRAAVGRSGHQQNHGQSSPTEFKYSAVVRWIW